MLRRTNARTSATYEVRYRPNDSVANAILRVALLHVGKDRCYICNTRVTFAGSQIDHIVPWTIPKTDLELIKNKHLTPDQAKDFGLHRPHNLAAICTACNSEKSDRVFKDVPSLTLWLDEAHVRQLAVEKTVMDLRAESGIKKAMTKLLAVDFSSATAQRCLAALGPALIDRFRSEEPSVLEGPSAYVYKGEYSDYGWLDQRTFADGPLVRPIVLDEGSRRAQIVLEDVFGWDFDQALDTAFGAVEAAIRDRQAGELRARYSGAEVGSVEGAMTITVNEVRVEDGMVTVRGAYEADGFAELAVVDGQSDSGTSSIGREVEFAEGDFEVPLRDGQEPEAGEVDLD